MGKSGEDAVWLPMTSDPGLERWSWAQLGCRVDVEDCLRRRVRGRGPLHGGLAVARKEGGELPESGSERVKGRAPGRAGPVALGGAPGAVRRIKSR